MGWPGKKNGTHALRVQRPVARTDELIINEVDGQVLIYDQRTHEAHCLSPAAAQVWRACDGETSRDELASQLALDAAIVHRALDELEACELLDGIATPGVTRREATKRVAKLGAAAASAPLIYSLVSPFPAAADSLTQLCESINVIAGHDCGNNPANPGCGSVNPGCCCCHNFGAPLTTVCANDPQHCCTSPAGCAAAGGHPCSND